jgi:hypothetical protein
MQSAPLPVTSFLAGPNILLSTLVSNILRLCSSLNVTGQFHTPIKQKAICFLQWRNSPCGPGPPHYRGSTITLRHTTLARTPLDEGSARRRDLYLTTHNTHNRQTSMPTAGFQPTILKSERPQTNALDRAATGIGRQNYSHLYINLYVLG